MKIIFLDFDGVLNSEQWMVSRFEKVDMHTISAQYPFYEIDPEAVAQLNRVIETTGAKVVVSSTWRLGRTPEQLTQILAHHAFKGEIIDTTPHFYVKSHNYTVPRGCEIEWWLKEKKFQRINWSIEKQREYEEKSEVKNYIILDDDSDLLYGQREHYVQTSWKFGLTSELADKCISILNKKLEELYYQ